MGSTGIKCLIDTGIPRFTSLHFYKDLHYKDLFLLWTERNLKRIFAFTKQARIENSIQHLFCSQMSWYRGSCFPEHRTAPPSSLPGKDIQHLSMELLKLWTTSVSICAFFKKILFIYLFLAVLGLRFCARAFSCCGAQAPDAQAQQLWLTGPVAPRHAGSSQTRARPHVPRIGRRILNHCATRGAPT